MPREGEEVEQTEWGRCGCGDIRLLFYRVFGLCTRQVPWARLARKHAHIRGDAGLAAGSDHACLVLACSQTDCPASRDPRDPKQQIKFGSQVT